MISVAEVHIQHAQAPECVADCHFIAGADAAVQLHALMSNKQTALTDARLGR